MLLLLPTFQAAFHPCPIGPAEFVAHEKGHFCGHCQRVVQDFSQSENPLAALAAARAAAPHGRVCGSFRREQVVVSPSLTRRLKWFLLALVLVVGQGLTAREALAQVRKSVPIPHTTTPKRQPVEPKSIPLASDVEKLPPKPQLVTSAEPDLEELRPRSEDIPGEIIDYIERMPTFRGGGMQKLVDYVNRYVVWPKTDDKIIQAEGRVFVSFIVDAQGQVRDAQVVKGFHPLFDAAALEVVRSLDDFKPGTSGRKPVAVSFTVPVTFKLKK